MSNEMTREEFLRMWEGAPTAYRDILFRAGNWDTATSHDRALAEAAMTGFAAALKIPLPKDCKNSDEYTIATLVHGEADSYRQREGYRRLRLFEKKNGPLERRHLIRKGDQWVDAGTGEPAVHVPDAAHPYDTLDENGDPMDAEAAAKVAAMRPGRWQDAHS